MRIQGVRKRLVSIGLPVHNGEATLGKALESLLSQTHSDFELIVSDNASTDTTRTIATQFAARDRRIRVVPKSHNIGGAKNFQFVLGQATADYFMWAAADDAWHPEYIAANLYVLERKPDIVASVSRVWMNIPHRKNPSYVGTFPLVGSYTEKLQRYLAEPGQNSRFYGLFRTEILRRSFVSESFVAADWATVIRVLRHGNFHEVDQELMERGSFGESSRLYLDRGVRLSRPGSMFPLARFTRWLFDELPLPLFTRVLPQVAEQNARFAFAAATSRVAAHRTPSPAN